MNPSRGPWWTPLVLRVLLWTLATLFVWAAPVALLGTALTMREYEIHPSQPDDFFSSGDIVALLSILCTLVLGAMGLITGALCGFYAPPREPRNPFRSKFWRGVGVQTFGWALLALAVDALLVVSSRWVSPLDWFLNLTYWSLPWLVVPCGFGLGLWHSLNRALRFARAQDAARFNP